MNKTGKIRNPFATNRRLLQRKLKQFERYLDPPILDIGAGFGQYTLALREQGFTVDCIEPDPEMRNPDLDYVATRDYYETGLLINVLHHVENPSSVIYTNLIRRCECLIIGELNGDSWLVRTYHRILVRDEIGLHFSKEKFQELLSDFHVIDFWTSNLGPFSDVHMFALITTKERAK